MKKRKGLSKIITAAVVASSMMFNSMSVFASPAQTNERVNLALGKHAEASSVEASQWGPDKTTDGITDRKSDITKPGASRWSSNALRNGQSPQWLIIDLGEIRTFNEVVVEWERNNITSYKIELSNDKESWTSVHEATSISALRDVISLDESKEARYIKVNVLKNNPNAVVAWDNISIYEVEVYNNEEESVDPPVEGNGENLALNKTAVASGLEVAGSFTADKITDGDTKTASSRWSSAAVTASNPQWIYVDLGEEKTFDKVKLFWQGANAKIYEIQISNDAQTWTSINRKEDAPGGIELISFDTKQKARYVRVFCEKNNPAVWTSVSLFEVEIYNGKLPETIDEVVANLEVPAVSAGDSKLTMPTVSSGYEINFIGADYKQVIGDDMTIYEPLVDTKVIVDFEITKGKEKAITKGLEIVVPGKYSNEVGKNLKPTVIPELREWAGALGNFEVNNSSRIVVNPENESELIETANTFAADYKDILGKEIEVVVSAEAKAGDFYLTLGSTYESMGEEGSFINIGDKVILEGNHPTGVFYGTRSILQILKQTKGTIPMGLVRDYPRYEVRGFMLDVGRKPITLDFLNEIVKTMSWYKMNDFQVHLNDNYIWVPEYGENAITDAYAAFRLESNDMGSNGIPLTAKDLSYTKEEFGNFIDNSRSYGVSIVPEFESPAHALAFVRSHPEFAYGNGHGENAAMIDVNNPEAVKYIKSIFNEYLDGENPVFRDAPIHVGSDEFYGKAEEYRAYTDDILKFMRDEKQRTTRVWGSLSSKKGTTQVTSKDIQMNIWNTGWADPSDMYDQGFDIINTEDSKLYIVPSAGYYFDYLNTENLYNTWTPNKFANGDIIPAGSPRMIGGMFAVWNDMIDKKANGIVEYDIFDRVLPAIQTLSEKMWGMAEDKTYAEFKELSKNVGTAPNTNPTFRVDSETEKVIEYKLDESIEALKDTSGNDYNIVKTENVESVEGKLGKAIELNGGASYIESPVDNIGPNYTISMMVNRDSTSGNDEQVLFESSKGAFKAVQKETGKVGFSREFYDFSFNYELPVDEWVELTVVGMQNKTQLYVNGAYVDEISKPATNGKYHGTFIFPLEIIGSKTNSFKGLVDEIVVNNTKLITDKTIIPQEYMTATSTSEQAGSEGPAGLAIDGNEGSIWHTKWTPKDELPQSITLNLGKEYNVNKFTYLPRQNGTNGNITSYEVLVSNDGTNFTKVSEGTWENNALLKVVEFEAVKATHVRLTAKAGVGGFASAAELNVHKVVEEEPVESAKVTIDSIDEVIVDSSFDVNLGLVNIEDNKEYYAADLTFTYNPEVFEFNEVTSENENIIVTGKKVKEGEVKILVASLGNPIKDIESLAKVNLKAIKTSGTEELSVTSAQLGDGEGNVTDLELASKNIVVKEKEIEEDIVVSKIGNLEAQEVTNNTVKLTWDAPKSIVGLTEYVVYKDGKEFRKVPAGTTETVIDELKANTIYGFKVTAKYSNGEESKPKSINIRTKKLG